MSTALIFQPIRAMFMALMLLLYASSSFAGNTVRWESLRQPYFQQIDTGNWPLEEQVSVFAQDHDGFIWLQAGTSLWRWDAYQFTATSVAKGESTPIVQTIGSDPSGTIWAGTANGLFRIVKNTTRLQRVNVPDLNSISISHLTFDYSGGRQRAFIASVNQVFEWDMRAKKVLSYNIGGAASNRIHAFHLDGQGHLWLGTTEGLLQKSVSGYSIDNLHRVQQFPKNTRVASIFTDHEKKLWVGTTIGGLFFLDGQKQFRKMLLPAHEGGEPWVYCINEIRPGILWFGTFGSGILEYDSHLKTFKTIRHNRLLKTGLLDDNVWSLFRDQRGLIWIGGEHRINLYDATQIAFTNIPGDIGASGLSDSQIHSVLAMPDDTLWLGAGTHGIDIINPSQIEVSHISSAESKTSGARLSTDPVEAMVLADSHTVLASSNWLTLMINRESHVASVLHPDGRASDAYSSAFAHYRNSTWVSGTDGLWRVPNIQAKAARNVLSTRQGELRVSSLLADGDTLWVGTWKGLKYLREDVMPPFAIHIQDINAPILDQQFIASMAIDRKNRLWLGTTSGGLFFNTREGIASKDAWGILTEADGLPANNISNIQVDDKGGIWASTSRGIAFVDQNTLEVTSIMPNQGAAAAPYIRASGAKNAEGEIIFGGLEGLTIVQPAQWRATSFKPRVVLTGIETNVGKTIVPETLRNVDGTWATHLFIAPDINRLTIEFAALDYVVAARLRYRYRLLGFDQHWHETDATHRTASFTSLSPDAYQMQVQTSHDGHEWQDNALSFIVDVAPAWYQTTGFRLLVFLMVALLLVAAFKWRTRFYRERQILLERKVSERTAELNLANLHLQEKSTVIEQISLTDPLTGLKNRRFLTQNIEADVSQTLRRHHDQLLVPKLPFSNADLIFFLVDIDNFKRVNDKWGHAAGDAVLVEMRRRLMNVFRDSDYLIRWGGEEFLAVARGTSREIAGEIAERIRQAVYVENFTFGKDGQINVTCSIGFVAFPFISTKPDALSWRETLAVADAALYEAKHLGRNTWVGFDTTDEDFTDQQIAEIVQAPESALQTKSVRSRNPSL